jgi:hypothetical protein
VTDEDDGHAVSYKVLRRGTPVRSSDGVEIGKVRRVHQIIREDLLDGIDVETDDGLRFVDAPEVQRIAERGVTLSITAAEVAELPEPKSRLSQRVEMSTTVRRAKRFGRNMRGKWDQR